MSAALAPEVLADSAALAEEAARLTAEAILEAVMRRGACAIALAGGQTPRGCYERLGRPPYQRDLPWEQVSFYWSDERFVPLTDPESNYRMARLALLDRLQLSDSQLHPMVGGAKEPAKAAEAYAKQLEPLPQDADGFPRFDLVHLGLGEDGHTASLFPGDPVLEERRAWVRAVKDPKPPRDRLTLTLVVLNAARAVHFQVSGAGKRHALGAVLRGDTRLPAARVSPREGELRFLVDREAFGRAT
jgi:6-phosphogluconolactonase